MNLASQTPAKLQRVSTVDAITGAIRERILAGLDAPGAPLREAEVCERYGVSRHSVRTAMRGLAASGLVQFEANHGVRVTALTVDDVRDIYALRRVLESEAVAGLAKQPERAYIVEDALRALEQLTPDADWRSVRDHDLEFHRALVASLGRPRTTAVFDTLMDEMRLAFAQLKPELEHVDAVGKQHRAILDAAQKGPASAAVKAVIHHLDDAENAICGIVGPR